MKVNKKHIIIILLLVCSYLPIINFDYTIDDNVQVKNNLKLNSLTGSLSYFVNPVSPGDLYRPITMLSYFGFNKSPKILHLENILLHAFCCILLYLILSKFLIAEPAFLVSSIFAIHPIHNEVIANITGRTELLSSFFMLSGIFFLIYINKFISLLSWSLCLLLGLLCKESAIHLIPISIVISFYLNLGKAKKIRLIYLSIICLLIYSFLRLNAFSNAEYYKTEFLDNPFINLSIFDRFLPALALLGKYIHFMLIPQGVAADYSFNSINFDFRIYYNLFCLVFLPSVLIIYSKKQNLRKFILFISIFFLSFLITANLLTPIGVIFAPRLGYFGLAWLLAGVVLFLTQKRCGTIAVVAFLIWCSIVSIKDLKTWKNDINITNKQLILTQDNVKYLEARARQFVLDGNLNSASSFASSALNIKPDFTAAHRTLAKIELLRNAPEKAIDILKLSLSQKAEAISLSELGLAYVFANNLAAAKHCLVAALTIDNYEPQHYLNWLQYLITTRDLESAKKLFESMSSSGIDSTRLESLKLSLNSELQKQF